MHFENNEYDTESMFCKPSDFPFMNPSSIIEPYVSSVGFVSNPEGKISRLCNLTIEAYQAQKATHAGASSTVQDSGQV